MDKCNQPLIKKVKKIHAECIAARLTVPLPPEPTEVKIDFALYFAEKLLQNGYRVFIYNHAINGRTWWTVVFKDSHNDIVSALKVCDSLPEAVYTAALSIHS